MPTKLSQSLDQFVPEAYYEMWALMHGISLQKYPYLFLEYDASLQKRVPYAVFNFYIPTVEDQKVAAAVVVYKSMFSKTQFRRLIYL